MKVHKKMRKSKKRWIVVSVVTTTLAVGAGVQAPGVAAETAASASSQPVETSASQTPAEAPVASSSAASSSEASSETSVSSSQESSSTTETAVSQADSTADDTSSSESVTEVQPSSSEAPASETAVSTDQSAQADTTKEAADTGAASAVAVQTEPSEAAGQEVAAAGDQVQDDNEALDLVPSEEEPVVESTYNPKSGLTETAYQIAQEAGLDINTLTGAQKDALNRMRLTSDAQTGTQMTYKQFKDIADTLVAQDPQYAIPYFNAESIQNMPAATTRDAQTGEVAALDVWDSWPVQDVKTGEVLNWNGYQLVIAMMGIPNTNDHHIYLLYNKYGDNNLANWKNAGSIFGYDQDAITQQWSGSASVNQDGSIQLYYTKVDTSDNNSNNQKLASATLNLSFDDENVYLDSVENDKVLTPEGGDGYYYQSYQQWRSTFTGADNIAMRDPHIIEDDNGDRYLIFEASTGTQNYQSEDQIYNWTNYGGDAAFNVQSLFRFLENPDMYERASLSNAAIGILKLTGDEKSPEIAEYYTPLLTSPMVSDEIERPDVVKLGDKYYLFAASRLNHGSNNDAWHMANDVVGDNVVMLGYVSDSLTGGYQPLNGHGAVLTASVPADWRTATYSYYPVPVAGSDDTVLVTAYMTNRNEVAGKGMNSTWAPSFLLKILPDNTTRVLAKMTQQGDWIWDEGSETQDTVGTIETAHLPGEDDGVVDSNIGGYGLRPHTPVPDTSAAQETVPEDGTIAADDTAPAQPSEEVPADSAAGQADGTEGPADDASANQESGTAADPAGNTTSDQMGISQIGSQTGQAQTEPTSVSDDTAAQTKNEEKASVNPFLAALLPCLSLLLSWLGFKKP